MGPLVTMTGMDAAHSVPPGQRPPTPLAPLLQPASGSRAGAGHARARLSPLDAWWLHLEREAQQLHVGSALLFEGPAPSLARLTTAIASRLDLVPRYRQRVRHVPLELGRPVWVDEPQFRIGDHVRQLTLDSPGSEESLRILVASLMSEHMDFSRPLWESWLVKGLEGGRWAMVNKTHHCMIDGVSGADIIDVLLDHDPHPRRRRAPAWKPQIEPSPLRLASSALGDMLLEPLEEIGQVLASAVKAPGALARHAASELYGLAQVGESVIWPESVLNGPIGPRRRWGWARADLAEVKKVKNALGGTVNDVILAAIAGGFRSLLVARGETVEGRTVRTMVPVSMRTPQEHGQLGNRVSAIFADLPVGLSDPGQRLAAVTRQLSLLKTSGMALGMDSMLNAADLIPGTLFALGAGLAAHLPQRAISTVTTNVPGPPMPMYLLGHRMTELFPYIPIGADIRITIGIVSYAGRLTCGVTGDFDAVVDLQVLCDGIESAIEELVALVR
jgi:diacylglycerol O-acyltransferase